MSYLFLSLIGKNYQNLPILWYKEYSIVVWSGNMPKIYLEKDVYIASQERFDYIFENFDNYLFSVSGGKDSSVMLQLAARKAKELGKKISVLYVDFEAQYKNTIEHLNELIDGVSDVLDNWYWIALPISLRNAVSVIQPK